MLTLDHGDLNLFCVGAGKAAERESEGNGPRVADGRLAHKVGRKALFMNGIAKYRSASQPVGRMPLLCVGCLHFLHAFFFPFAGRCSGARPF